VQNAGQLLSRLLERVRDPQAEATTRPQGFSLLTYSQQAVNACLHDVVSSAPLVLQPRTCIYQLSLFLPSAVKVLAVHDADGVDLEPLGPFEALSWADLRWPVAVTDMPRSFTQAGHDLLILYPGPRTTTSVNVFYSLITPPIVVDADTTVLPNESDDALYDLGEILMLLKNRDLGDVAPAIKRFSDRIGQLRKEKR